MADWLDSQVAWSGEEISRRKLRWAIANRKKLKKQFTRGEQAFCRIIDKMKSRLPVKARKYLWYSRQQPWQINSEIVFFGDFYFKTFKLLIEIDGASHASESAKERDRWREQLLAAHAIRTVRFHDNELLDGDFRAIELRFIHAVAGTERIRLAARIVERGYFDMTRGNPHIYTAAG